MAANSTAHAAALCRELLHDTEKLAEMRNNLKGLDLPNAANIIFQTMDAYKKYEV